MNWASADRLLSLPSKRLLVGALAIAITHFSHQSYHSFITIKYIYIYICINICVCVCVCTYKHLFPPMWIHINIIDVKPPPSSSSLPPLFLLHLVTLCAPNITHNQTNSLNKIPCLHLMGQQYPLCWIASRASVSESSLIDTSVGSVRYLPSSSLALVI